MPADGTDYRPLAITYCYQFNTPHDFRSPGNFPFEIKLPSNEYIGGVPEVALYPSSHGCLPPRRLDSVTRFCSSLPIRYINLDSSPERRVAMEYHFKERCANRRFERFRAITVNSFDDLVDRGPADLGTLLLNHPEANDLRQSKDALRDVVRKYATDEGTSPGALCLMAGTCHILNEFSVGKYDWRSNQSHVDSCDHNNLQKLAVESEKERIINEDGADRDHDLEAFSNDVLIVMEDDVSPLLLPLSLYGHAFDDYLIATVRGASQPQAVFTPATDPFKRQVGEPLVSPPLDSAPHNEECTRSLRANSLDAQDPRPVAIHLERIVLPNQFPPTLFSRIFGWQDIFSEGLSVYSTTLGLSGTAVTVWNKPAAESFAREHFKGYSPLMNLSTYGCSEKYLGLSVFQINCETDMAMRVLPHDRTVYPWLFAQRLYNPIGILQAEREALKVEAQLTGEESKDQPLIADQFTSTPQSSDSIAHLQSFVTAVQVSIINFELASDVTAEGLLRWEAEVGISAMPSFMNSRADLLKASYVIPASPHQAAHLAWLLGARALLPLRGVNMAPWRVALDRPGFLSTPLLIAFRISDAYFTYVVILWLLGVALFVMWLRAESPYLKTFHSAIATGKSGIRAQALSTMAKVEADLLKQRILRFYAAHARVYKRVPNHARGRGQKDRD